MVSQANATPGSVDAIDYLLNDKGQAVELDRNLIAGSNGQEILKELREVQRLRPRTKNNIYNIYLSPDKRNGKLSLDELREIGQQHLKNLGLQDHQYLMAYHPSTENPHIHFIVNRVSLQGKTHNDSFISKKAQTSAEDIAKQLGHITAKEVAKIKKELTKELRAEIYKAYNQSLYNAKSYKEFERNMHNKGYTVELTKNKQNKIQGFRILDRQSGQDFKASEINRHVRFSKLTKRIDQNIKKERQLQQQRDRERQREQNRGRNFGPSL